MPFSLNTWLRFWPLPFPPSGRKLKNAMRWNLKTKDGVEVRFPEKNLADAMDYLSRIEAKTGLLDEPLEYVDLRNADNFVYRKRGAVELDMPLGQVN